MVVEEGDTVALSLSIVKSADLRLSLARLLT